MNAMTLVTQSDSDSIDAVAELIRQGIKSWEKAARIIREKMAVDPSWLDKFHEKNRCWSVEGIKRFSELGLVRIAELEIAQGHGAIALRRLSLEEQRKWISQPLPLLIKSAGGWEELLVELFNLTADQAAQIFARDHVRSIPEQRAWIEDVQIKALADPIPDLPYRIIKKEIIFLTPPRLKKRDLQRLLKELENCSS